MDGLVFLEEIDGDGAGQTLRPLADGWNIVGEIAERDHADVREGVQPVGVRGEVSVDGRIAKACVQIGEGCEFVLSALWRQSDRAIVAAGWRTACWP